MHVIGRGRYARETYPQPSTGGLAAFQNRGVLSSSIADLTAPSGVIVAAANPVRLASGIFVVMANFIGTPSAADTLDIGFLSIATTTAWSGGVLSPDGKWRVANPGPITATGSGALQVFGSQQVEAAGAIAIGIGATGFADFSAEPVGSNNLIQIIFTMPGGNNLSDTGAPPLQALYYELP
jgi:hypothetical protein